MAECLLRPKKTINNTEIFFTQLAPLRQLFSKNAYTECNEKKINCLIADATSQAEARTEGRKEGMTYFAQKHLCLVRS